MTQNQDKEVEVILIKIVSLIDLLKPENLKLNSFGQEPRTKFDLL